MTPVAVTNPSSHQSRAWLLIMGQLSVALLSVVHPVRLRLYSPYTLKAGASSDSVQGSASRPGPAANAQVSRVGVTREMVDYYERRAPNPALDFIERAAAALEVSVADLLGSQPHTQRAKPGPVSQLERRIEQVKLLPRKKQQLIIEFLDAIISTEKV